MIPIGDIILEPAFLGLAPYCKRMGFTLEKLIAKINAIPDSTHEKPLVRLYFQRLLVAYDSGDQSAIEGWLTATWLGAQTAGVIMPQASEGARFIRGRRLGGKSRSGQLSDFNHAVMRLADRLHTRDVDRILQEMRADCDEASDLLEDLRAHPSDPVRIRFVDVPDEPKETDTIAFIVVSTGEEHARTLKTMKNNLRNR